MEKDQENQPDSIMEDDQDSDVTEMVAPPYVPANKLLWVKIKFPNMKKKSMEEEDMEDGPKVKDHFRLEFKKRFSSGKALGGHMSSAHVQGNKDFSLKKLKSKKKRQPKQLVGLGFPSGYGEKNICKICYREFLTKKSLFEHVRSHPDREWRGMKPPDEAATNFFEPEFGAMNEVPSHVLDGDQLTRLVNRDSKPSEDRDSKVKEGAISSNYCTPEDETDDANQDFHLNKNRENLFPVGDERNSHVKKLKVWERTDENPGGTQSGRAIHLSRELSNTPSTRWHRSSHKKFKVKIYYAIDDPSSIGASYIKYVSKANAIKELESLGVQNQCLCTSECNRSDHVTSTDEAKKERTVYDFDLIVTPNDDGEKGMEPDNTAS
ncbi:uncharacterized protein LOC111412558 [Olea europaea var. sylvestris]|uniref:Zinc finger ZAT9-like n=1 Tax=Olea europaea subsp. europaea TaxID=158383 RepID=A0A8S0SWU7_OLEEU|nr:uncharacterized protein LOC111412558 [Olea europaea var. sylvestris]CAA2997323.1 zinc finger ZAT9-like [Olea europaea subsp. europaea]